MKKQLLIILLSAGSCLAQVTDSFLDRVAFIESSNNPKAIGDGGLARGMFQFHRAAWTDAQRISPAIGDYETGSLCPQRSRLAAKSYLTHLENRFEKRTGRKPSQQELYAVWQCGFGRFFQLGGKLENCPASTRKACEKI